LAAEYVEFAGDEEIPPSTSIRSTPNEESKSEEHIVAVQSQWVKLKRFQHYSMQAESTYGDLSHVDFGDRIYGDHNEDQGTLFEDDDSDEYFSEDGMVELSNPISAQDRGFETVGFILTE
jgi:hypothetical protein